MQFANDIVVVEGCQLDPVQKRENVTAPVCAREKTNARVIFCNLRKCGCASENGHAYVKVPLLRYRFESDT